MLHKVRLSVLWLLSEIGALATVVLELVEIDPISPHETGLLFAILHLGSSGMAFLSLTLKDKANRWANIILGIVYTVLGIFVLVMSVIELPAIASTLAILTTSSAVFTALVVWYAYKWPKG
jgi:hypothetical protein